ncbi:hypothetical protein DVH24_001878 [Malus domestica]|uniref:Uncharacterized protein n=1 Tax=Malus domestica TaxID=3750 RepID=A0A498I564_MALDO|nr:hypothetical protein DVH24_001878 [Malus domestica]
MVFAVPRIVNAIHLFGVIAFRWDGTRQNEMGRDRMGQDGTERRGSKDALGWKQRGIRRRQRVV